MLELLLPFAFALGFAAFFNPCGLVILVAYITGYLKEGKTSGFLSSIFRGAYAGALASIGFILLFLVAGLVLSLPGLGAGELINEYISQITILLGIVLVIYGVGFYFGKFHLSISIKPGTGGKFSFLTFGAIFAIASLGCTLPLFLSVVVTSLLTTTLLEGLAVFFAYSIGMSVAMIGSTILIALSRETILRYIKKIMPYMNTLNSIVLVLVGLYLIYTRVTGNVPIF